MNAVVRKRPAIGDYIPYRHKRVARMIGLCLALGDNEAWWRLPAVLRDRLDVRERIALAVMALDALDAPEARMVADGVTGRTEGAGHPPVPFGDGRAEAGLWAAAASASELRAYVMAGFEALSSRDRRDVLDRVNGRVAA